MIVLRGNPDDVARVRVIPRKGLLSWLYDGQGLLLIPEDFEPAGEDGRDTFLEDLQRALTEPLEDPDPPSPWRILRRG